MPGKFIWFYGDSNEKVSSPPIDPTLQVIARYKALLSLSVQSSSLEVIRVIDPATLQAALDKRPDYISGAWPKRRSSNDAADDVSALHKLKALLDFRIDGPIGSAEEVAQFHAEAFAEISKRAQASTRYKLYALHAEIWSDGSATWGYQSPVVGAELPGLSTDTDLDEYLQSLARTDIRRRLETATQLQ